MAIPTPVNGQITDAVEMLHAAGGVEALAPIVGLLEAVGRGLSGAGRGASSSAEFGAEALSAAFAKAEAELQAVLAGLKSAGDSSS